MNLYFAPLEGIGGYIYRNAQADYFEKADKYYSPFLAPNQNRSISPKEYKDIAPEHNEDITLVPQIMANNAEIFLKAAQDFWQNRMHWNSFWRKCTVSSISDCL